MSPLIEQIVTWSLAAASVTGVILNIKKKRISFAIWMVTNSSWAVIDYYKGIPAQACLFFVYFILSVWGWFAWAKKDASVHAAADG